MLESAKLIGAGAATIALAGEAVGIGNVFSSLIHSVARNPSFSLNYSTIQKSAVKMRLNSTNMQARKLFFAALATFLNIISAFLFGRFLGSEGRAIMPTGLNLVLFGTLILLVILLFHRYSFHVNEKYGFRLVFMIYIYILFFFIFLFLFSETLLEISSRSLFK